MLTQAEQSELHVHLARLDDLIEKFPDGKVLLSTLAPYNISIHRMLEHIKELDAKLVEYMGRDYEQRERVNFSGYDDDDRD